MCAATRWRSACDSSSGYVTAVLKSPAVIRSIPSPRREHSSTDALLGGGRRGYGVVRKVHVLNLIDRERAGKSCFIGLSDKNQEGSISIFACQFDRGATCYLLTRLLPAFIYGAIQTRKVEKLKNPATWFTVRT